MPGVSTTTRGDSTPAGASDSSMSRSRLGIVVDRADPRRLEHLRERALHHLAVLEHVRHAGRAAQVVFEHVDLPVAVADQIGAGDVAPDAPRRVQADALLPEAAGRVDEVARERRRP